MHYFFGLSDQGMPVVLVVGSLLLFRYVTVHESYMRIMKTMN